MKLSRQEREHLKIVQTALLDEGILHYDLRRSGRSHLIIEWTWKNKPCSIMVSRCTGPTAQNKVRSQIKRVLSGRDDRIKRSAVNIQR